MGCTHFFWMTPHASCPSESHERAGWDGRRKRLGLAGATGCPGKGRAPQAAARGGTGCPGEVLSSNGFVALILFGLIPSPRNCSSKSTQLQPCGRHRLPGEGDATGYPCFRHSWSAELARVDAPK